MENQVINKPIFFLKKPVQFGEEEMVWSQHFGIFPMKRKAKYNQIEALIPVKKWYYFFGPRVVVVHKKGNELRKDPLKIDASLIPLLLNHLKERNAKPYSESFQGVISHISKDKIDIHNPLSHEILNSYKTVWCYDDHVLIVANDYHHFSNEHIKDIIFFVESGGKEIYTGNENKQDHIYGLSKKVRQGLKERFIELGSKIGKTGEEYSASFSLWNWIKNLFGFGYKESISILDDAVRYDMRKGKKSDTTYLPLTDILYYTFRKKKLIICGKQNIKSNLKFPRSAIDSLKSLFETLDIDSVDHVAQNYRWMIFGIPIIPRKKYGSIGIAEKFMIIISENIVYHIDYDEVSEYAIMKPRFFSFKKSALIRYSKRNIREDQSSHGLLKFYADKFNYMGSVEDKLECECGDQSMSAKKELKKLMGK